MLRISVLWAMLTVLTVAASAQAAPTVSGTLDLAADGAGVGYDFAGAPLLEGPEAAVAAGLGEPLRRSAARYAPMALTRVVLPPGRSLCGGTGAEIADERALLQVESVDLRVLKGRGAAQVALARAGDGPYGGGEYPAPGLLREPSSGCAVRAVGAMGDDVFLGPAAPESLLRQSVRLRFSGGAWRGSLAVSDPASAYGPATEARATIVLAGTPVELNASCTVPSALRWPGTTVRTKRAAKRLLARAGFERVRYAGVRHGVARGMRGRYVVLASSSVLPCDGKVRVHRGAA